MRGLGNDIRVALRSLGKTPGFLGVTLLSLGLGIGTVTTVYTWTDRFLVNPLPEVENASRLVTFLTQAPGGSTWSVSYPSYRDWSERNRSFEGMTVQSAQQVGVRMGQGVERAWASVASANVFDVLGVRAMLGRTFRAEEEHQAAPVAVLGYGFWQRRFDSDSTVVGRTITLNGHDFAVVGVMPPRFGGSYVGLEFDVYVLVTTYPILFNANPLEHRGSQFMQGVARLKPGVTMAMARADMDRVGNELDKVYPDNANHAVISGLTDRGPAATMRPIFLSLLGITGLILLIACANVANLLLARSAAREKEIAVRLAVGADRSRVVRQLLTESALLALVGGAAGVFFAAWGRNLLAAALPPTPFPLSFDFQVNGRVLLVAAGLTSLTVLIFGLWPAIRATRPDLVSVLKDVTTGSRGRSGGRNALVVGQVALAVVSLVSAGLFLRAMQQIKRIDPGFTDPDHVLLVTTDFQVAGVPDSLGPEMMRRILTRIRAMPGVRNATSATFVPLSWSCCSSSSIRIDGYEPAKDENMSIVYSRVSSDYFATMGIDLVKGRGIAADDQDVAVVNEAFVRRFWPGKEAIGREFQQQGRSWTVVGVARDGHYQQLTDSPFPLIYRPYWLAYNPGTTIHVRTVADPRTMIEPIRAEVRAVYADLPFLGPRTLSENMLQSTIGQQLGSKSLAVFGGLALLLAAIGIYGVMAYSVAQRTREIGVRVALGAATGDVARLVMLDGLRLAVIGGAIGAALAVGVGQLVKSLLLGVSPADPLTFGVIGLLIVAVALVASLVPARRAVRVDPIVALKAE